MRLGLEFRLETRRVFSGGRFRLCARFSTVRLSLSFGDLLNLFEEVVVEVVSLFFPTFVDDDASGLVTVGTIGKLATHVRAFDGVSNLWKAHGELIRVEALQ